MEFARASSATLLREAICTDRKSGLTPFVVIGNAEKKETVRLGGFPRKFITPVQIVALTAAFILTFDSLGYLLASTLYLFVLFIWVSRYRFWTALGLAIAFGAGSWLFFGKVLTTSLPQGFLPL